MSMICMIHARIKRILILSFQTLNIAFDILPILQRSTDVNKLNRN